MDTLSDQMRERLEKWRKNPQPVPSTIKIRGPQNVYIPRKDSGDEYEEEALLQKQNNRSTNGKRVSR